MRSAAGLQRHLALKRIDLPLEWSMQLKALNAV